MDVNLAADYLARHIEAVRALTDGVSDEDARWRPREDDWSLLEVVGHLLDEERMDFRVRLDYVLHRPGESWPKIDPLGWVTERGYNEREMGPTLGSLVEERNASLQWLSELTDADLSAPVEAPWGGELHGGDMLSAWVAHDVLHLRQLVELRFALVARDSAPYVPEYAGDW